MISDIIIKKLKEESTPLILVLDPDNLLTGEEVLRDIYRLGYTIVSYEDPEVFRYYYEENIRSILDKGQKLDKRYIVRYTPEYKIPFDIGQKHIELTFSLRGIFPKLSYDVVRELKDDDRDKVFVAYESYKGPRLGDRGTKAFILERVYGILPGNIKGFQDLVKDFMPLYYRGEELPGPIAYYTMGTLAEKEELKGFPIENIVLSREGFFRFIQGQWEDYVKHISHKDYVPKVDFEDPDIRPYMDNLFLENILSPVKQLRVREYPTWMQAGIIFDEGESIRRRFENGLGRIRTDVKYIKSYRDWFDLARIWAEMVVLKYGPGRDYFLDHGEYRETGEILNTEFKDWLFDMYGMLPSLSYAHEPVMVHKIPWHIDHLLMGKKNTKIALVVMDGMSLDNWYVIKEILDKNNRFLYDESLCFAWVPTITSISRQGIFSGEVPQNFQDTLLSTDYDGTRWKKFWGNRGYTDSRQIAYKRGIRHFNEKELEKIIDDDRMRILGLVVNMIDDIMHGQKLSLEGMHQDIRLWMENNYFEQFLGELLSKGFEVFITSDHGNIAATGQGRPQEGLAVEKSSERVRFYNPGKDYRHILSEYRAFKWEGISLPQSYDYILCEGDYAFVREHDRIVTHGGISIEEVIVPFIHIKGGDKNA